MSSNSSINPDVSKPRSFVAPLAAGGYLNR